MVAEVFASETSSIHTMGKDLLDYSTHDEETPSISPSGCSLRSTSLSPAAESAVTPSPVDPTVWGSTGKHPLSRTQALHRWHSIVAIYAGLDLTYATDRLVAIAGIMRCLQPAFDCKYVAGLWDFQLELQLLWYCSGRIDLAGWRPVGPEIPSWLWAASPSKTYYVPVLHDSSLRHDLFKVLSIEAVSLDYIETNSVAHGTNSVLRVTGKITLIPVVLDNNSLSDCEDERGFNKHRCGNKIIIRGRTFGFIPDFQCMVGRYYSTTLKYDVMVDSLSSSLAGLVWKPTGKKKGEMRKRKPR